MGTIDDIINEILNDPEYIILKKQGAKTICKTV